jgi:hypothetical protein
MPAALLRLLPLLLGFLAQGGVGRGLKALQGVQGLSKVPGAGKALGFLGRHPTMTGIGAFVGTEMGASHLLGLNHQAERISGNDENFAGLRLQNPQMVTENETNFQNLMQDEDLRRALHSMGVTPGGLF